MAYSTNLSEKHALVFGAAGSIGSAVAVELAEQGAEVFLSGRTKSSIEALAAAISAKGGRAHAAVLDAADGEAVDRYVQNIVKEGRRIDLVFNAMGPRITQYGNGRNAVDLGVEEFMLPLTTLVKSQFITARAAARQMMKQRSGAIVFLTGSPARGHVEGASAIGAAFGAIETFMENLAVEVGPAGVRAVCLRTTANTDSRTIQETMDVLARHMKISKEQMVAKMADLNFLKTPASVRDTAKAVAFLASDEARMLTGTVVNATAGAALD